MTWVGTCRNPNDGKDYLISYNDCCGVTMCGRCFCNHNEAGGRATAWAFLTTSTGAWPTTATPTTAPWRPSSASANRGLIR